MPTIGITAFSLLSGSLVALSQHPIAWLHRISVARWLRTVGKYSYGMYIYHIPIYVIMEHAMGHLGVRLPLPLHLGLPYVGFLIAVTFLVAKISYDYFESPILAMKRYFKPRFANKREERMPAINESPPSIQAADGTNA